MEHKGEHMDQAALLSKNVFSLTEPANDVIPHGLMQVEQDIVVMIFYYNASTQCIYKRSAMHRTLTKECGQRLHSHGLAVPSPEPFLAVLPPLPRLVRPEDSAAEHDEADEVVEAQSLGLEHLLQPGEVDDEQLAHEAHGHGPVEERVGEEPDLAAEHRLGLGPARERVEHVEEHKARERHGRVAPRHLPVPKHLVRVHHHCPQHHDEGRLRHPLDQRPSEDRRAAPPRWPLHDVRVDALDA